MPLVLEGLVTTIAPEGTINLAPMGPIVDAQLRSFTFRPFKTAATYRNLVDHGEGVFHITDDVLLLAKAALGPVDPQPPLKRALAILGYYLPDVCRFFEFRVTRIDAEHERVTIETQVVNAETLREFFGFNRAKHAVLEAAILATRLAFLPRTEIEAEFKKLEVIVGKTGGPPEIEAFAFLSARVMRP